MKVNSQHVNPNNLASLDGDQGVNFMKQGSSFTPSEYVNDTSKTDGNMQTKRSSASDSSHKSDTKTHSTSEMNWQTSPKFEPVSPQLN